MADDDRLEHLAAAGQVHEVGHQPLRADAGNAAVDKGEAAAVLEQQAIPFRGVDGVDAHGQGLSVTVTPPTG
ncbi:MAG TPA: hypothetical protein PKA33_14825 [Amaricoccus sp.]|uniref:hypothetical protein n=1 Tax=Amaricoccus sp. TaxID=1872485 RepID=UPI002BB404BA|nr:hypothetical protein [Amaricoccus sp.]HMQ93801.1 hypothetical protein [Amaricoccus sp.]HMR53517.1 hypothetical protein [Amaricoccus sp.]HMU00623.1 hypothetical protein [Amaricoccus sp.]